MTIETWLLVIASAVVIGALLVEFCLWWSETDERIAQPPTLAEDMQAERDMDSVRAALTECEPSVRRVRAGGAL